MTELRQLVGRYVRGEIDYREFRRAFVAGFLSIRNADPDVESAANAIESECADLSEKVIDSEEHLRARLNSIVEGEGLEGDLATVIVRLSEFRILPASPPQGALGMQVSASGTFSWRLPDNTASFPDSVSLELTAAP